MCVCVFARPIKLSLTSRAHVKKKRKFWSIPKNVKLYLPKMFLNVSNSLAASHLFIYLFLLVFVLDVEPCLVILLKQPILSWSSACAVCMQTLGLNAGDCKKKNKQTVLRTAF